MKIDIFQDTVCPWCRLGKKHLFDALEQFSGADDVEINLRAFMLDPTTPLEGRPASSLAEKFGGEARVQQAHEMICHAGEACGLTFDFQQVEYIPNTMLSHQLIQVTPHAQQVQMSDALLKAYFEEGKDIGNLEVLVEIAVGVGLDAENTRAQLIRGDGKEAVSADLEFARTAGISGVPFFVINDKYAISGAQPIEVFLQTLERASSLSS